MALIQNTFNGGPNGLTITAANSGGASGTPFNYVEITSGAGMIYSLAGSFHGDRGCRITGNGAGSWFQHEFVSNPKLTMRFHVSFPSVPTANCQIYTPRNSSTYIGGINITTALKFQVTVSGGASIFTSAALTTDTWYRVEIAHEVATSSTGKIWFKYFLGDSTTPVETFTSTTANLGTTDMVMYRMGKINATGNTPMDIDSVTFDPGSTAYLGPHTNLNVPPVSDPGTGLTDVEPGTVITLNGGGSADPDGSLVSYSWAQTTGPAVTLSGSGVTRTFTAPATIAGTVLGFTLTVTDNQGAQNAATVAHSILPCTERAAVGGVWVPVRMATL